MEWGMATIRYKMGHIAVWPSAEINVKFHDKLSFPTTTTVRGIYVRLDCDTSLLPRSRRVQVKLFRSSGFISACPLYIEQFASFT
jgi:hypothetical protein